jgi:hypothetical protein
VRQRRVQYLQDPGHRGVLREDIDGEREELKELDLARKHSSISLKRQIQGNRKCVQEWGFRAGRREAVARWENRSEMQA